MSIGQIGERRIVEPSCGAIDAATAQANIVVQERKAYSPHAANASLKARSPGAPFSMAMMARRWLT